MNTAFVKIWNETVGAVAWNENTGIASFEYDPNFVQKNWDLSPLKMPISRPNRVYTFRELQQKNKPDLDTFKGLPGLLADVLPDRYGSQLINVWLAQNGRAANSMNPVELLCFIGKRGMGALEFEPAYLKTAKRTFKIEVDSLVEIAKEILHKKEKFTTNLSKDEKKAIKDILKIGTSAGGARPKAIIAYNPKTGEVKSGQTQAPRGFGYWLLKLDAVSDVQFGESEGYGRVEMAYYLMAKDCEIEMMESQLLEENGRAHFMTKRFDREDGGVKHHIQTWCAMEHFDYNEVTSFSYEQLFQTMRTLRLPYPQAEQMFRRMVFNVVAKNCDDHTKNFAFRLKKDQNWEISPAYDICYAYNPKSKWVSQHALSINGKRKDFSKNDLLQVGKSMNIKKANSIITQITEKVGLWRNYAEITKVPPQLRDSINDNLVTILQ